ncbi:hypothetical protein PkP19E3_17780 [Pseudomonas koreensis]|nr:hypothetical protein PkP19E3_17780 [Pseudomonas koreensis]
MNKNDAAIVIDSIISELNNNPNQFNLNVSIKNIGVHGIGRDGGTGIRASAVGGGVGSTSIGMVGIASTGNMDFRISEGVADDKLKAEIKTFTSALEQISNQLKTEKPDKGLVDHLFGAVKDSIIPSVVKAVVAAVIAAAF